MTIESVLQVMQQTLQIITILILVVLMPALIVGLVVSMFQAATQINEVTLSFIPKLMITLLVLAVGGPWMLRLIVNYTKQLINNIPFLIG
ncbi:MAG: flagellar biosynthesis protein FliQ [Gammaproteobacteria bacterium]|nr:MAG: flagellar biosynthesis protein FliQ [Gammaproteobacteria bacterium]